MSALAHNTEIIFVRGETMSRVYANKSMPDGHAHAGGRVEGGHLLAMPGFTPRALLRCGCGNWEATIGA